MRTPILIRGNSERVYLVRFKGMKYEWLVREGDPLDRDSRNYLSCQEVRPSKGQGPRLAETVYSGGSGAEIVKIREVPNTLIGFSGKPSPQYVEHAPDDNEVPE